MMSPLMKIVLQWMYYQSGTILAYYHMGSMFQKPKKIIRENVLEFEGLARDWEFEKLWVRKNDIKGFM